MSHAWPKVHEETYRGHLIEIIVDETPLDPREDAAGCCLGTMVTWHRRYTLGDEQPSLSPDAWIEDLAEQATGMNYEDADPGEAWADRLKGQIRNRVPLGYREPTSAAAAG